MTKHNYKTRSIVLGGLIVLAFLLGIALNSLSSSKIEIEDTYAKDEQVIYVPENFGDVVAVGAYRGYSYPRPMTVIVFERGVIAIQLERDKAYEIVYVGEVAG